jgi:ABC-2 type transport system permease protein
MTAPGSLLWLARHEGNLAWRDLHYLMTAGGRWRLRSVMLIFLVAMVFLHLVAYSMVARHATVTVESGPSVLIAITGSLGLSFFLMLSQALEQVTRLFYSRGDLDLFKSSPVPLDRLFGLRVASIAISTTAMALIVAAPVLDVLMVLGGARWALGFGVAAAGGLATTGLSLVLAAILFDTMGPRRTRLAAQIASAIVGSAFIIGIQAVAILSIGTLSPQAFLQSAMVIEHAPAADSWLWLPARAMLGDGMALLATFGIGILLLALPMQVLAKRLGDYALAAAGIAQGDRRPRRASWVFRKATPRQLLRRKEWVLLLRDPWLASQSLMQMLYLIPSGLLLWRCYGDSQGVSVVLAPVLTMAAGQLGGGLAWLAVSGEDAPDLIASAPMSPRLHLLFKIEAVLLAIFAVFAPFLLGLLGLSWKSALVVAAGIGIAALSSTLIQIWFRGQASRRHFRRRQTSSRIATFAEAFSSVAWAATAAVAAGGSWLALGPAVIALLILWGAWTIRPRA